MSFSDPNSLESLILSKIKAVKQAIANATSTWSTPYRMKETEEFQKFLNAQLVGLGLYMEVDGIYGPAICEAMGKLFYRDLYTAQELKRAVGNCDYAPSGNLKKLPSRSNTNMAFSNTSTDRTNPIEDEELVLVEEDPVEEIRPLNSFCKLPSGICLKKGRSFDTNMWRRMYSDSCNKIYYPPPPPQVKGVESYPSSIGAGWLDSLTTAIKSACNPPNDGIISSSALAKQANVLYGPCQMKNVPNCGATPSVSAQATPDEPEDTPKEDEDEDEDDNKKYMVGGLLGLLIVGGIIYAVSKKKKKKGGRK